MIPVLLPIGGRTLDYFYFEKPHGGYERFHAYRPRSPFYYAPEIKQYQVVQTSRNELTFYYTPSRNDKASRGSSGRLSSGSWTRSAIPFS